jgi:hypothetical protein
MWIRFIYNVLGCRFANSASCLNLCGADLMGGASTSSALEIQFVVGLEKKLPVFFSI